MPVYIKDSLIDEEYGLLNILGEDVNQLVVLDAKTGNEYVAWECDMEPFEPVALIPVKTENRDSHGWARCSSYYSDTWSPYKAFDGKNSTYWESKSKSDFTPQSLMYDFNNPVHVHSISVLLDNPSNTFTHNDVEICLDISDIYGNIKRFSRSVTAAETQQVITYEFDYIIRNVVSVELRMLNTVRGNYCTCAEMQVYGKEVDYEYNYEALIPDMTSDTEPSGVASCGSQYSSSATGYCAFDNHIGTQWLSSDFNVNSDTPYLKYAFAQLVTIERITYIPAMRNASFQNAYDTTIYFDLETTDGTITVEKCMAEADIFKKLIIPMRTTVEHVQSIKVRFAGRMRNGGSVDSAHYVCCAEMQAYGCIEN